MSWRPMPQRLVHYRSPVAARLCDGCQRRNTRLQRSPGIEWHETGEPEIANQPDKVMGAA